MCEQSQDRCGFEIRGSQRSGLKTHGLSRTLQLGRREERVTGDESESVGGVDSMSNVIRWIHFEGIGKMLRDDGIRTAHECDLLGGLAPYAKQKLQGVKRAPETDRLSVLLSFIGIVPRPGCVHDRILTSCERHRRI